MQVNKIFSSLLLIGSFGCHASLYRVDSVDVSVSMSGFYNASDSKSRKGSGTVYMNLGLIETKPTTGDAFTVSIAGYDEPCTVTGGVTNSSLVDLELTLGPIGLLSLFPLPNRIKGVTHRSSQNSLDLRNVKVFSYVNAMGYVEAADGLDRITLTCPGWIRHHRESYGTRTNITVTAVWHLTPNNTFEITPERRSYDVNCQLGTECRVEAGVAVTSATPYVRIEWGAVPGVEYVVEGRRYNSYSEKLTFYSEGILINRVDVAVKGQSPHNKIYSIPVTATVT